MPRSTLADLCDLIVDCPHKTAPATDDPPHAYAVGTTAIGADGAINFGRARPVDEATYATWVARAVPQAGDLIFCREAPVGPVALITAEHPRICLGQRTMLLRPDRRRVDPRWLAYVVRSPRTLAALLSLSGGSTVAHVNVSDVKAFEVDVPPLVEQQGIARVLDVIDRKIAADLALARRLDQLINIALERATRSDCTSQTLGEIGTVVGGGTPKSAVPEFWEPAEVAWITPKDMTALTGHPVVWRGERGISNEGLARSSAKLLPAGAVLYTSRATLGLLAVAQQSLATNQGFISMVPREDLGSAFVLATLRAVNDRIVALANGSTFLEVNKTNFKSVGCLVPTHSALAEFRRVSDHALSYIATLVQTSRRLGAVRDELLPKLISGEIRVPAPSDEAEAVETVIEQAAPDEQHAIV